MKKILLSLMAILLALNAGAQVKLIRSLKPVESRKYKPQIYDYKNRETFYISIHPYTDGFSLWNGVLNDEAKEYAYAVFSLKGEYDKISFVMGPGQSYSSEPNRFAANDKGADIVLVKADGRNLVDEVVRCWDAPREYVLDISGVDILRFENWSGLESIYFGDVKLWKKGQTPQLPPRPQANLVAKEKVNLVEDITPHLICHRGWSKPITTHDWSGIEEWKHMSINRNQYYSGIAFSASQELGEGISSGFAYFWLQKAFDKVSFVIGPWDQQSHGAEAWFTVKGDGKIIYEKLVKQTDLAETVVLDVTGINVLSMHSGELEKIKDMLAGMSFGVVDIYAYKNGCPDIPTPGLANASQAKLAALPDVAKLCSNIKPFSVRGSSSFDKTFFDGSSSHYTFSMGGEQFDEGFILTTGNGGLFLDENINAFYRFDLAGEFDWVSFTVGTLTKHRVLDDDKIRVYADDQIVLETTIHSTWPNQHFTIPIYKCRTLTFAKPGTGKDKQTYFGFGDITLYRGKPVDNNLFVHPKPPCPETADLIDLCKAPYFHYVGRYLSTLTNFDFNDCFKNGGSQREYFQMKDGSKIYKGVMLETNIPLAFENISLSEAAFMFMMGAGSAMSSSSVGAATGVTAGAGMAGSAGVLNLVGDGGRQSSVVAFNPFKEYETCTFTVANKSEFTDKDIFGKDVDPYNPVHLMVFADRVLVGDFVLNNKMQPSTFTVPINKCEQLMFWLKCENARSGQYVLYDMTVSKAPYVAPEPVKPVQKAEPAVAAGSGKASKGKSSKAKKEVAPVVWDFNGKRSRNEAIDPFLADVTAVWNETQDLKDHMAADYNVKETWVEASDGAVYKIISFVDRAGNRLSTTDIQKAIISVIEGATAVQNKAKLAMVGLPSATIGIMNLGSMDDMSFFGKYVKMGKPALNQCIQEAKSIVELKNMELETVQSYIKRAVNVGQYKSTARVMILPQEPGDTVPAVKQRLEYFSF
jgi:hypothetical protein